jgi:hypothetical protein
MRPEIKNKLPVGLELAEAGRDDARIVTAKTHLVPVFCAICCLGAVPWLGEAPNSGLSTVGEGRTGAESAPGVGLEGAADPLSKSADMQVQDVAPTSRYPERIRPGGQTPVVWTAALNHTGEPVPVACSTCHASRFPDLATRSTEQLDQFHQGLAFAHGEQSCLSCHDPGNYDQLRKADGTRVSFPNVMELCAQCHGPQFRDYKAGAHGGMNGYWDLTKGPRDRNNCVDCHDPHAPAYPILTPVFAPVDRGVRQQVERASRAKGDNHE